MAVPLPLVLITGLLALLIAFVVVPAMVAKKRNGLTDEIDTTNESHTLSQEQVLQALRDGQRKLAGQGPATATLTSDARSLRDQAAEVQRTMNAALVSTSETLRRVEAAYAQVDGSVALRQDASIGGLQAKVQGLSTEVGALTQKLATVQTDTGVSLDRIRSVRGDLEQIQAGLASVEKDVQSRLNAYGPAYKSVRTAANNQLAMARNLGDDLAATRKRVGDQIAVLDAFLATQQGLTSNAAMDLNVDAKQLAVKGRLCVKDTDSTMLCVDKDALRQVLVPVDCQVSEFSPWTLCDKPCNGGQQTRTRTIIRKNGNNGSTCPPLVETRACNTQGCSTDCQVSEWSSWSACDKSCGGGTRSRSRTILRQPLNGGGVCPALTETAPCNTQPCPVDCTITSWSNWSPCDKSCGGGTRTRTRSVLLQAANGGAACPTELSQSQSCNTQACPIDCEVSSWSAWSACDKSCGGGTRTRSRTVTRATANGGASCPPLTETEACNTQACPADCQVSDWSSWSACSQGCGGGTRTRSRTVTRVAAYGGASCPALNETQACNTHACPVDCQMSSWSSWTPCDKSCGGGTQTRTRSVLLQAANGGAACPTEMSQSQSCNTQACSVDCQVSDWSSWSSCDKSCGGGTQTRTRSVLRQAANGGAACPTEMSQSQSCNTQACPVDCQVSAWSSWSSCDKSCGGGTQTRTRSVLRQAANGGAACPTEMSQSQSCNTQACPVDCQVSDWSGWSSCDKSCGGGTQTRTRSVLRQAANGGAACPTEMSQSQSCNTQACPVDCQVSDWSGWSSCDKSCGGGTQTRTRSVLRQAANGGAACPTEMSQSQSCNTQACPVSSGSNTLFSFSSHVFTNAGATGSTGPSIQQVRNAYSSASWAQSSQYLSMNTQGIQRWTVPATGSYRITAVGAKGGNTSSYTGGAGASVTGTFTLTQGQILDILVGQAGTSYTYTAGGGGGSFVVRDGQALLVAGGGGGAGDSGGHGKPAQATSTDGSVGHPGWAAGTNGNAGTQSTNDGWGTTGAGFKGDSISQLNYGVSSNAKSFANGGVGAGPGSNIFCGGSPGGFGGGGGGACNGGGGGGGYSGGGAGGGGGGSYNGGSNPSSTTSSTEHGSVMIELLSLSSSSSSSSSASRTYTEAMPSGASNNDAACQRWSTFCESLTGSYTWLKFSGSQSTTGVTCSDSSIVNGIAQALRTAGSFSSVDSQTGINWIVGVCGGSRTLSATGSTCSCEPNAFVYRPCIGAGNGNWGGAGTTVCGGPEQTIKIEFGSSGSGPSSSSPPPSTTPAPPTASSMGSMTINGTETKSISLTSYFSGSGLSYSVTSNPYSSAYISGSTLYVAGTNQSRSYSIAVQASNSGGTATSSLYVTETPSITAPGKISDLGFVHITRTSSKNLDFYLPNYFSGSNLNFSMFQNPHNNAYISGNTMYVTAGERNQNYLIQVMASNSAGNALASLNIREDPPSTSQNVDLGNNIIHRNLGINAGRGGTAAVYKGHNIASGTLSYWPGGSSTWFDPALAVGIYQRYRIIFRDWQGKTISMWDGTKSYYNDGHGPQDYGLDLTRPHYSYTWDENVTTEPPSNWWTMF